MWNVAQCIISRHGAPDNPYITPVSISFSMFSSISFSICCIDMGQTIKRNQFCKDMRAKVDMVVSLNKGNSIQTPKHDSVSYWDPQNGTPYFREPQTLNPIYPYIPLYPLYTPISLLCVHCTYIYIYVYIQYFILCAVCGTVHQNVG